MPRKNVAKRVENGLMRCDQWQVKGGAYLHCKVYVDYRVK